MKKPNNELYSLAKDIYTNIVSFVNTNKGNDATYYGSAYVNMQDGRVIRYHMENDLCREGLLEMYKYTYADNQVVGSETINMFRQDDGELSCTISLHDESLSRCIGDLTNLQGIPKEEIDRFKAYLTRMKELTSEDLLVYDTESVHKVDNLTQEAVSLYKKEIFQSELDKSTIYLGSKKVLPSVHKGVNYLVNRMRGRLSESRKPATISYFTDLFTADLKEGKPVYINICTSDTFEGMVVYTSRYPKKPTPRREWIAIDVDCAYVDEYNNDRLYLYKADQDKNVDTIIRKTYKPKEEVKTDN